MQYIRTERAHLMCPNMLIGMKFHVEAAYESERVQQTLDVLAKAHPFLCCTIQEEFGHLCYYVTDGSKIQWEESEKEYYEDFTALSKEPWDVFNRGLLQVYTYQEENGFTVLYGAHHLLGDGRSIVQLMEEFAAFYLHGIQPEAVPEQLMAEQKDLPSNSQLSNLSDKYIKRLNTKWENEHHPYDYQSYMQFHQEFTTKNPVKYVEQQMSTEQMNLIRAISKANNVTINTFLLGRVAEIARKNKVVMAVDLRKEIPVYKKGALGNYATAFGVKCGKSHKNHRTYYGRIKRRIASTRGHHASCNVILSCYLAMNPELIDAMVAASFGNFSSKAAKEAGRMLGYGKFEGIGLTNLGRYDNADIKDVVFIPPASPANGQTVGVITVNGQMNICRSIYTNVISQQDIEEFAII